MKIYRWGIFVVILTTLIQACSRSTDCFQKDILCAALVTDTLGINDHGVNQEAWQGLEQSKADGIVDKAEYIESVDARDYEKNISYFTQKGFDVIITSGIGLQDETSRAAEKYPDSVFIGINQTYDKKQNNLISITFAEDKMGFFAGVLAARLTKTHIVGAVCETSGIDSMWRYCEGFRAGARSIDEEIKVVVEYRDNGSRDLLFIDEAWGKDQAEYLIKRGADVIFAAGGVTAQGALRTAAQASIYAIGTERDQATALDESDSVLVTSVYGRAGLEVQNLMRSLKEGNQIGSVSTEFGCVPLNDRFDEGLKQQMDELLLNLVNKNVQTNIPSHKP